jgi:hypothetical protein
MKRSLIKKNDFHFLKRNLFVLILLCVLFACHKDNSARNNDSNPFFKYSGNDALVIKTIGQLKQLNDKKPFADSLNSIGSFKWDAYIKSVAVDTGVNNYKIVVPYVNKQNVLAGYITVSVIKKGIDTKPIVYNYEKDYLNNKDLLQRYLMGNVLHVFGQKNIILAENITAIQEADKKQMALVYAPKTNQQSITKSASNGIRTLDAAPQCENTYYIEYLYYGADNQTNIPDAINDRYLTALQNAFANNGAQFSITEEGLVVYGPTTELNQISLGALTQILETIQGVSSVISSEFRYGTCAVSGGGGGTPPSAPTPRNPAMVKDLLSKIHTTLTPAELTIFTTTINNMDATADGDKILSALDAYYIANPTAKTLTVTDIAPAVGTDNFVSSTSTINMGSTYQADIDASAITYATAHEIYHQYETIEGQSAYQSNFELDAYMFGTQVIQQMPSDDSTDGYEIQIEVKSATTAAQTSFNTAWAAFLNGNTTASNYAILDNNFLAGSLVGSNYTTYTGQTVTNNPTSIPLFLK